MFRYFQKFTYLTFYFKFDLNLKSNYIFGEYYTPSTRVQFLSEKLYLIIESDVQQLYLKNIHKYTITWYYAFCLFFLGKLFVRFFTMNLFLKKVNVLEISDALLYNTLR